MEICKYICSKMQRSIQYRHINVNDRVLIIIMDDYVTRDREHSHPQRTSSHSAINWPVGLVFVLSTNMQYQGTIFRQDELSLEINYQIQLYLKILN